ncbi:DMT family transporter [Lentiprolixibacter aurantiacus]|uniref:EamA family transporter n=1 Tax=Lentiprolixibacter aurantiacus TaxID=2993939 RepID=A0AAE3MIX7_9FLAO|nr:EamA family transporter [Lentiprolixibacter aurantiacus]MCX2718273.1 EamA family transporter [Lentiprolixibacter aurantiacus]
MSDVNRKWFYLITLSLIWGTSYILIKKSLEGFNPVQMGSVRIVITALFLFIYGLKTLRGISREQWKWVAASGMLGSFFPVFLFAFAQTEIDSGIASILNSCVPLFTIFVGYLAFRIRFTSNQLIGVIIGLIGASLLIFLGADINPDQNYWYAGLVIIATICYALNANIIKGKLQEVSPLGIAVGNFVVMLPPAIVVLLFSGALSEEVMASPRFYSSIGYLVILSIMGTCVAKVMFNRLIQISTPVFSVSVTYLIPVVGIFWGVMDGERFSLVQLLAAVVILVGVYLVNKKKAPRD